MNLILERILHLTGLRKRKEFEYRLTGRRYLEMEVQVEAEDIEAAGQLAFDHILRRLGEALTHPNDLEFLSFAEDFEYDQITFTRIEKDGEVDIDPTPFVHRWEL